MVQSALAAAGTLFVLMALGYFVAAKGFLKEKGRVLLSRLVLQIGLPATIISSVCGNFTRQSLLQAGAALWVPLVSIGLNMALCAALAALFRVPPFRRGVFISLAAFSNTIFVGLPVVTSMLGERAAPYALLFYVGNTVLFWSLGALGIERDGNAAPGESWGRRVARSILTGPLPAFVLAAAFVALGLRMPDWGMKLFQTVGGITTPLSLFYIGAVMHRTGLRSLKLERSSILVLLFRFLISPALAFALVYLVPLPGLARTVFVLQAGMPAMTQTALVAGRYGADEGYAAGLLVLTTLVSLFMLPLYALVLGRTGWI